MPECARCRTPFAPGDTRVRGFNGQVHWAEHQCIVALLAESDRLRGQFAAELALSGAIARLEQYIAEKSDNGASRVPVCQITPGCKQAFRVLVSDQHASVYEKEANSIHAALTAALDESERI
jgi:hypothetical protein